jgi:hypothetical protein
MRVLINKCDTYWFCFRLVSQSNNCCGWNNITIANPFAMVKSEKGIMLTLAPVYHKRHSLFSNSCTSIEVGKSSPNFNFLLSGRGIKLKLVPLSHKSFFFFLIWSFLLYIDGIEMLARSSSFLGRKVKL